jgi:DNA-binding XRE family transcriptional regulator
MPTTRPLYHNRIRAVLQHTTRFAFKCQARLADAAGVSESCISRLIRGEYLPSFTTLMKVIEALERETGKPLAPRELISLDGTYPTASVCELVGCKGCLPEEAYNEDGTLKPEYVGVKPGAWELPGKEVA